MESTLKEYYIKLTRMYDTVITMLTALNQSLSSTSPQITVTVADTDDAVTTVRIPSFLYLESKVEQLNSNFEELFKMPMSGEAWFANNNNVYKLNMVRTHTAPASPVIAGNQAYSKANNILKDMVCPKTYFKMQLGNIPDYIEQIYMKKLIIYDGALFSAIKGQQNNNRDFSWWKAGLDLLKEGVDYEIYDSVLNLPIKKDVYKNQFKIRSLKELECGNPYMNDGKLRYEIILDTLQYYDEEDSALNFTLKAGDHLCIGYEYSKYVICQVNKEDTSVIIEEEEGHINLVPYNENNQMVFSLYNNIYKDYRYVEVPLEENQYVVIFLGTIFNNVRSVLSNGVAIDLQQIKMYHENGEPWYIDDTFQQYDYMTFYNKYCSNIGDLIQGLSTIAYPQVSNYSVATLDKLREDSSLQSIVSDSLDIAEALKVLPINEHLLDTTEENDIQQLHAEKNNLNAQIKVKNEQINDVYNSLTTTDFSQELKLTQVSLKKQLDEYYTERELLQKQLISVIDNINIKSKDLSIIDDSLKYRIRGIIDYTNVEAMVQGQLYGNDKVNLIALEVQYKYTSINQDTTSLTNINSNVFTDWNRLNNIERQRNFVDGVVVWEEYNSNDNKIKWNQIDIPIKYGEDVIIRIRFKYNIGQPFINLYTPWSDEKKIQFPQEYAANTSINQIIKDNDTDTISAKFNSTLINEGYQEHITNKIISSDAIFFHMPENIYSGFNTSENKMISLKDKLYDIYNELNIYKNMIENTVNMKYDVSLLYDGKSVPLANNIKNVVNIPYPLSKDNFTAKNMSIVIKNIGDIPVRLYSIFPGAIDTALILSGENDYFNQFIWNYERVPLREGGKPAFQTLGQWIYFRQNNPYTYGNIYYNNADQREDDIVSISKGLKYNGNYRNYMAKDDQQVLFGYRERKNGFDIITETTWQGQTNDYEIIKYVPKDHYESIKDYYENIKDANKFRYKDAENSNWLMCYEDIGFERNGQVYYLDEKTNISTALNNNSTNQFDDTSIQGAFLYPNLELHKEILLDKSDNGNEFKMISPGDQVAVPIRFEFFIRNESESNNINTIAKSINFDIRTSLMTDVDHYQLQVVASADNTISNKMMQDPEKYDPIA